MSVGQSRVPKAERFSSFRSVENQGDRTLRCSLYAEPRIQTIFAAASSSSLSGSNLGRISKRNPVGRRDKPENRERRTR